MPRGAAKPHISLRVEPDIEARIIALQQPDETKSAAYNRVLAAGVDALTTKTKPDTQADTALIAALEKTVDTLTAQLDVKDGQITALQDSLRAAQTLHMQAAQHKAIEAPTTPQTAQERTQDVTPEPEPTPITTQQSQPRRGGLLARIFWGR